MSMIRYRCNFGIDYGPEGQCPNVATFLSTSGLMWCDEHQGPRNDDQPLQPLVIPAQALSIRQPWAWLIVHGHKDFENRDWSYKNPGRRFRGDFLVHAAKGCTAEEYAAALIVARGNGVELPPLEDLPRGGIVGMATMTDWVNDAPSGNPWAFGSGLKLVNMKPFPFIKCKGALGFFKPAMAGTWEGMPQ